MEFVSQPVFKMCRVHLLTCQNARRNFYTAGVVAVFDFPITRTAAACQETVTGRASSCRSLGMCPSVRCSVDPKGVLDMPFHAINAPTR